MGEWRDVPGYEGLYKVSDAGTVWSRPRRNTPGGLLSPRMREDGYQRVNLCRDGKIRRHQVHRLVLEAFMGPCPEGQETRHLNGDPADNRLENLCWGTHSKNTMDSVKHGTHARANRTHCIHGHEFTEDNTYITTDGSRRCRPCNRRSARAYYQRKNA